MIIDPFTGIIYWDPQESTGSHIAHVNNEGVLTNTRTGQPEPTQPANVELDDEES